MKNKNFFIRQINQSQHLLTRLKNTVGPEREFVLCSGIIFLREFLYKQCPEKLRKIRCRIVHDGLETSNSFIITNENEWEYMGIYFDDQYDMCLEDVYNELYELFKNEM